MEMETEHPHVLPMAQVGQEAQTVPLHSHPIVLPAGLAGLLHQRDQLHRIVRLAEADSQGPTVHLQRIVLPVGQTDHHQIMAVHLAEPGVAVVVEDFQVVVGADSEVGVEAEEEGDNNIIHSA